MFDLKSLWVFLLGTQRGLSGSLRAVFPGLGLIFYRSYTGLNPTFSLPRCADLTLA